MMPEPYRSACVALLYEVFQWLRHHGFGETPSAEELSDLGYLLHNLPGLINSGKDFNVDWLRRDLKRFDEKWNRHFLSYFEEHLTKNTT